MSKVGVVINSGSILCKSMDSDKARNRSASMRSANASPREPKYSHISNFDGNLCVSLRLNLLSNSSAVR